MRRLALAPIVALLLVALVSGSSLAARPAPSPFARAGAAVPGATMQVVARVNHAVRGTSFAAIATATFAIIDEDGNAGEVAASVTLRHAGRSYTAVGRVAVPADAVIGLVPVVVTLSYGTETFALAATGKVLPSDCVRPGCFPRG